MSAEVIEASKPDDRSVGVVRTQTVSLFNKPEVLETEGGATLSPINVAYETYGTLSEKRDNAIFVCHALTGDAHAAGFRTEEEMAENKKPGWWDGLIGPGKGLDTDKYFVICANVLGGCQGTTGPKDINPETGQPYGQDFPVITVGDIVKVHSQLVSHLGIDKLLGAIGGSLGGMQVLEWAAQFPDQIGSAMVLASGANLSAQGIAFNTVGRRAILSDANYQEGQYYDGEGPHYGLALARMLAHITYLSEASIEMKFGRRLQHSNALAYDLLKETEFQIESYLHYQGRQFVGRFDANSYLHLTKAMDYFNLYDGYGTLTQALGKTSARFLVVSYETDWLFTTTQSKELVSALLETKKHTTFVEFDGPFGHDSFLIEVDSLEAIIEPFLAQAQIAVSDSHNSESSS